MSFLSDLSDCLEEMYCLFGEAYSESIERVRIDLTDTDDAGCSVVVIFASGDYINVPFGWEMAHDDVMHEVESRLRDLSKTLLCRAESLRASANESLEQAEEKEAAANAVRRLTPSPLEELAECAE